MHVITTFDLKILSYLNNLVANWGFVNKLFAQYLIYALPVLLIVVWFWPVSPGASRGGSKDSKKAALRAGFSVILAWPVFAFIIGKLINRPRPFNLSGIHELVFHRPDYSFPSDHAAALFAVAFSFWLSGYKKISIVMFAVAIVISFFRVATAIHYPTDVIAGAAIGIFAAYLIFLFDKPLDIIYRFIIKTALWVKLA